MKNGKLWGIDLGGTKMEGVVLKSLENPEILCRIRRDTEAHLGHDKVIENICSLVRSMSDEIGEKPASLGIAHPGVVDSKSGLLKNCNALCLNGHPVREELSEILNCKVVTANDANCFALAEALLGAGKGAPCVFGVILGTGVGGGLVIDGKARYGCQGVAGEWGHNVLFHDGDECYCGKRGCIEQSISGPALQRFYERRTGQKVLLKEIVDRASSGNDPDAKATMEYLVENFGRAIAMLVNILDTEVIVIGGGVSNIDLLYSEGIERAKKYVFNDSLSTKILKNKLGDSSGFYGAATLTINYKDQLERSTATARHISTFYNISTPCVLLNSINSRSLPHLAL